MGLESAILGATAGLIGAGSEASAIRQQARFQSQAAQQNALFAERQAQDATVRGQQEAMRQEQGARRLRAQQRVAFAGQGVDAGAGSPADVLRDTTAMGAADALTVKLNAAKEAFGIRSQTQTMLSQARLGRVAARGQVRNTLLTGGLGAARDVLYGAQRFG